MNFTLDKAKKIVEHYKYLLGENILREVQECEIHKIVIAPTTAKEFNKFLEILYNSADEFIALGLSGYDKDAVKVILLSFNDGNVFHYDIERYLTDYSLEKVYNNDDF